jgi:signal transduction histidine kinase/DNA-binding NarL/FixJ family response regulator
MQTLSRAAAMIATGENVLSTIRPALIARLYKAIDQHRLSDAILLLSQQYGGTQLNPDDRATHFLQEIREEGERMVFADRMHQAEELFALALALYDRFFPNLHFEGIAAARRLSELMSDEKRDAELSRALDYAYEVVKRLEGAARGERVFLPANGQIADSLVRRHQIGTYVDLVAQRKVVGGAKPLQVLVVEDNEDDAVMVKEALTSTDMLKIETHGAQLLSEGIERLRSGGIDVVVLDLSLPDSDSIRTLQKLRDKAPNVPVVILTGHDDDDFAFRAIKNGAHDYLVKGRASSAMVLRSVLRAAEERFMPRIPETPAANVASLIEYAPSGMMHLSNDLTVFAMNSAFISLVGSNWTGKSLPEIWPEFTAERLIEATERGGGVELTLHLPLTSAHKGTLDLALWPTRTPEGTTDGIICMVLRYEVPPLAKLDIAESSSETRTRELEAEIKAGHQTQQMLRTRVVQQTALASISQIAQLNVETEEELFDHAVTACADAIRADLVVLMKRTDENRLLIKASSREKSHADSKLQADIDFEPLYRFAYNSTSAIVVQDFGSEPFARPPKALLDLGIKSGIMSQVKGADHPYGLLCAFFKEPYAADAEEVLFLNALAIILAASVERRETEATIAELTAELKRSNSDLQQFAYAAAHDLQEPLRSVVSYLELVQQRLRGKTDEKTDKYINTAMNAGKRMQNLISDLLEYSRITTRGHALVRTDMSAIVQLAIQNLDSVIHETGATITFEKLPQIPVDPTQIVLVIQNLIANAIKFRKVDVAPKIKISCVLNEREREYEFVFSDNGIGMDMEYADRIFVIFQRLHTRQKYGGTGIGLALCKKIVERHGGRIWVQSELGAGSEFHFTIPRGT